MAAKFGSELKTSSWQCNNIRFVNRMVIILSRLLKKLAAGHKRLATAFTGVARDPVWQTWRAVDVLNIGPNLRCRWLGRAFPDIAPSIPWEFTKRIIFICAATVINNDIFIS
ncbi:MAG TPA: hypothetical protein VK440_06550, partial [Burkholderiales bacterium]|nr:hypothetical protein [Burkholderiales bacterium]